MTWLLAALVAAAISGTSALFDKLLLRRRQLGDPLAYTIGAGVLGAVALILLLFDPTLPGLPVLLAALIGGAAFLGALFLFFWTLKVGEASGAFPIIGGLAPIFTLILATVFLRAPLGLADLIGFGLIVGGSVILLMVEELRLRFSILSAVTASAFLFGVANILRKIVLTETSFLAGVAWLSVGGTLASLFLLTAPGIRRRFRASLDAPGPQKGLWLANRLWATIGTIVLLYAFSLGHPALVDASQGFRYVVVFFGAWLLLGERFGGWILVRKGVATALIIAGLSWLGLVEYTRNLPPVEPDRPIAWGVTFSSKFSRELELDWRDSYSAILDELRPERLRLIAYWDEVEPEAGTFTFDDLDWQIRGAADRGIPFVLAVGLKTPRWPECHIPAWARPLAPEDQESALHQYVRAVVERYREEPHLAMWQVENEPLLWFGQCPSRGRGFLRRETALVRSLDPKHPILTTDGGELGLWAPVARHGDVFGTTMYRKAYPRIIGPIFGHVQYPLSPVSFRVKERFVRWWNQSPNQRFIVIELQAEPWEPRSLKTYSAEALAQDFSPKYFRDTIEYAKAAGFDEYYLWGAEWWLYMGQRHDDWRYWEIAREIFSAS